MSTKPSTINRSKKNQSTQRGAALMIMLVILIVGASTLLVSSLNNTTLRTERDQITTDALAKAKEALISYAVSVQISSSSPKRLGDLPCPDNYPLSDTNEGTSSSPCVAVGRLPWKTLGIGDLKDSGGERLWYAVSSNFKNNPRIGTLNSDTPGTITVRNSSGNIINNGCISYSLPNCPMPGTFDAAFGTGAVAVIFSPGNILLRQDGSLQNRSTTNYNTTSNYLDIATINGVTEDNSNFTELVSTNGFINGPIIDTYQKLIVNDQITIITQSNIMQVVQKRVAAEVKQCLDDYALNNNARYPWAAPITDISSYDDTLDQQFGRIPDKLDATKSSSSSSMNNKWSGNCNTHSNNTPSSWWQDWRELVFYALSDTYKPGPSIPASNCISCLTVSNDSSIANKKFIVIVAGKKLAGQARASNTEKIALSNYLEPPNNSGSSVFMHSAETANFNDTLVFQK
jgi:hypothetical protein